MSNTVTAISYNRPLNPPARFELNADHLPTDVRTAYLALAEAATAKATADRARDSAAPADRTGLQQACGEAQQALDEAATAYGEVGGTSTANIRDSAAGAFTRAVEDAASHIRAALDSLEEVGQAQALYLAAKPGRAPVKPYESGAALGSPLRMQLSMLRGQLREVLGGLPEDIDD